MYLSTEHMRDKERLVNNYSVNSFRSENNELTITRTFDDRKYSTLHFKPVDDNQVDIVITKGEHRDEDHFMKHVTSGDIKRVYSTRAKLLVGAVFFLLAVMMIIVLICFMKRFPLQNNFQTNGTAMDALPAADLNSTYLTKVNSTLSVDLETNETTTSFHGGITLPSNISEFS